MRARSLAIYIAVFSSVLAGSPVWSAVGRTPGSFEVTQNGAATYTIPIFAPPGPQGMQPDIALVYDSNGGVGPMGRGWSIAGLSAITRCAKTISQDGAASRIQLVASDGYCMDGNRLRVTSGTYGQVSSTYQTEIADFSLVTITDAQGDGPLSFTVKGKNGLYYDYGSDGNSRVIATGTSTPTTWMLREIRDRSNNRVRITYAAAGSGLDGMTHPTQIDWTATTHNASTFQYSMLFTYGANVPESSPYGYVAGTVVTDDRLLDAISVTNGGNVVKKYKLAYNISPTTGAKRLAQVTECSDNAESDCLLPSVIGYQDGQAGVVSYSSSSSGAVSGVHDVNGDGFPDRLSKSGNQWRVTWGTQSGADGATEVVTSTSSSETALVGDMRGVGQADVLVAQGSIWWAYQWNGSSFVGGSTGASVSGYPTYGRLGDVNGDGRKDLLYFTGQTASGGAPGAGGSVTYRLSTSSTSSVSFSSMTTAFTMSGLAGCGDSCVVQSGPVDFGPSNYVFDYNGDGKVDFLGALTTDMCYPEAPECGGWYVSSEAHIFVSQPSGGYSAVPWLGWDGYYGPQVKALAVNDDACTDLIVEDSSGVSVARSPCDGVPAQTFDPAGSVKAVMDWDGDGRRDILVWPSYGSTLLVQRSLGGAYAAPVATSVPCSYGCEWSVVDRDGDGQDDLEVAAASGTISYYLHNSAGIRPDLATSFADGYGVTQSVSYVSASWNNYTRGSSATSPNYDFKGPFPLVASATSSDGIGGTYTLSYLYSGAAWNREGRGAVVSSSVASGRKSSRSVIARLFAAAARQPSAATPSVDAPDFAGMGSRRVTDSRTGAYSIDYYEHAFPYSGALKKTESYQPNGQLIYMRETTLGYTALDSTSNNQRYFIFPNAAVALQYEVGGPLNGSVITQTDDTFFYDSWGNITDSSTMVLDRDTSSPNHTKIWSQSVSNTITPDTNNWCLGLPTDSTVYYEFSGEAAVFRRKSFTPDSANCRITSETTEPYSSTRSVGTSYGFDSYGNVSSVSVTGRDSAGSGMTPRTASISWGTTGQFPEYETNPLSQPTTRTFHSTFGSLLTEADPNGIVVANNTYDAFGRLTRSYRPGGASTAYFRFACHSAGYVCEAGDPASAVTSVNKTVVVGVEYDSSNTELYSGSAHYFDQLDRPIVSYYRSSNGFDRIGREYDEMGRVKRETAPCIESSCSVFWTTNTYDLLGRQLTQSRPQSQSVSTTVTTTFGYAGRTRTITDPQNKVTTKILDVNGRMRRSQDHNGYYQVFSYDAAGSVTQVTDSLSNSLFTANYSYGIQAFQDAISDMDLGARNYYYNSLGELTSWTDAKSQSFSQTYDPLSRVTSRTEAEGTTEWGWGNDAGAKNIGRLAYVSMPDYQEGYFYDSAGRITQVNINSDWLSYFNYTYSNQGLLDTITYPYSTTTRVKVKYGYAYGSLQSVTDWTTGSAGTVYWTANSQNARGQTTQETLGNGVVTNRAIDAVTGLTSSIQSGVSGGSGLQNQSYLYDLVGNVTQRQESNVGLTENFYYDNLYRLDYSTLNSSVNLDLAYDAKGNITSKTGVGAFDYTTAQTGCSYYSHAQPHAVRNAGGVVYCYDANGNMKTRGTGNTITWSSYNYPMQLATATESTNFYYGPDRQYYKQVYTGPTGTETTYYRGGLLELVQAGGVDDWRHSIVAEGQVVAIVSRLSTGSNSVSYPLEDHEGSSSVLTNSSGGSIVKASFDAFGLPRNGSTWSGAVPSGDKTLINGLTRRGYTFHSMLGDMGLIHMNGRVQDAITGRFLSPDPFIPNPGFTQSYNRYAYVNNNPLSYIDPSGFAEGQLPKDCPGINYVYGGCLPPPPPPLDDLDPANVDGRRLPCEFSKTRCPIDPDSLLAAIRENPSIGPAGVGGGTGVDSQTPQSEAPCDVASPPPSDKSFSSGFLTTVSTINPLTSRGGTTRGANAQSVPFMTKQEERLGPNPLPSYTTKSEGIGLNVGVSGQSVWAYGSGTWTGTSKSVNVSLLIFSASYFWTPGDGGWDGISFGVGLGFPGVSYENVTTTCMFKPKEQKK